MIHPRTLQALEFGKVVQYLADLCICAHGREKVLNTAPFADCQDAVAAMTLYEQAAVWASSADGGGFALAAFPDSRGLLDAIDRNEGRTRALPDAEAFWALREMLRLAQRAHDSICRQQAAMQWPSLLHLAEEKPLPAQLLAALNRCISDDALIRDESSPELYRLRGELRRLHQNCLRKVKELAQKYNMLPYLQDEFMTLSSDRYVLPLKANFKGRMQGIIHDWSQTGETCYFEPLFLVELNNRLQELKHEEREEERRVLDYLTQLLETEQEGARAAQNLLAELDSLQAKRRLAALFDGLCVSFTPEDQGIELIQASHPLLSLARRQQKENGAEQMEPVRPLDIVLRPGERALVITGGNAGGKTVCLKTLGLIAAMSMSGLPVPAGKGSHLPWFDRMDAFIGDEQSLDDNVSTFTAQIDHLSKAWKHLGSRGLVLLDEFGAGTDPAEGSALAQAVLDELLDKNCFALAATHFPALKSYALTRKGARAASMLFNPQNNRPLFKIAYDQVGASQALAVAEEHGLPKSILARARHYLLQDGQDSSALLARLNALAAQREEELAALRAEEEKSRRALNEKREKLEKERARLRDEVSGKIAELMRAWKAGRAAAKQSLKEMSALRAELAKSAKDEEKSVLPQVKDFAIGQNVFHAVFNKRGVVTDIDERRRRVRLDMDGVSLWAEMKDVRESGGQKAAPGPKSAILKGIERAAMTLDVRGMRASEAIAEVERFLDRAILAGYSELEIVHGKGTGALRREIQAFLQAFPAVREAASAPADRGGDGMTIARLG